MKYRLVVTPEAEDDLGEIFTWYETHRAGLGHEFLLQVDAGFRFIERSPATFAEQYRGVRRYLLRRFPYKVFYHVEGDLVVVLAIIFGGRDPNWIKRRLGRG